MIAFQNIAGCKPTVWFRQGQDQCHSRDATWLYKQQFLLAPDTTVTVVSDNDLFELQEKVRTLINTGKGSGSATGKCNREDHASSADSCHTVPAAMQTDSTMPGGTRKRKTGTEVARGDNSDITRLLEMTRNRQERSETEQKRLAKKLDKFQHQIQHQIQQLAESTPQTAVPAQLPTVQPVPTTSPAYPLQLQSCHHQIPCSLPAQQVVVQCGNQQHPAGGCGSGCLPHQCSASNTVRVTEHCATHCHGHTDCHRCGTHGCS